METLAKVVRTNVRYNRSCINTVLIYCQGLPYLFRGAQARVAALAPATAISIPMCTS